MPDFTPSDLAQLAARGISRADAERQLAQLRGGQQWMSLARPCTVGDGIRQLPAEQRPALLARFAAAARDGRVTRFVPASGAATRMFQPLLGATGPDLRRFLDGRPTAARPAGRRGLAKLPHPARAGHAPGASATSRSRSSSRNILSRSVRLCLISR